MKCFPKPQYLFAQDCGNLCQRLQPLASGAGYMFDMFYIWWLSPKLPTCYGKTSKCSCPPPTPTWIVLVKTLFIIQWKRLLWNRFFFRHLPSAYLLISTAVVQVMPTLPSEGLCLPLNSEYKVPHGQYLICYVMPVNMLPVMVKFHMACSAMLQWMLNVGSYLII